MVANSLLSLPYYLVLIFWEREHEGVASYLQNSMHPLLLPSLALAILLAFSSEFTGTTIFMKQTRSV